ncbi:MAG: hypothetical protein ACRC5M_06335 [Anaeroplasmataceae bacterium]
MGNDKDWCPATEVDEGLNDKDRGFSTEVVEMGSYNNKEAY